MNAPPPRKGGSIWRAWPLFAVLVVVVGGISMAIVRSCRQTSGSRAARDAFFDALHERGVEAAYAELSSARQASMSLAEFKTFIAHPVFGRAGTYTPPEEYHPGVCMDGWVGMEDGDWYIQLFFVQQDDGYAVHSIALQRPTPVHLGTLLSECGFGSGTMRGYSGPPPEPAMRPTSQ